MNPVPDELVIGPAQAALIGRRVSLMVGSRDAGLRPHTVRAAGCRLSADHRQVTVFLSRVAGRVILDDVADNGRLALAISEPTSDMTLQLKGSDAQQVVLTADDLRHARAHRVHFADEIGELGFPAALAFCLLGPEDDLVGIRFTPQAAFEQTPGPRAGHAMHGEGA